MSRVHKWSGSIPLFEFRACAHDACDHELVTALQTGYERRVARAICRPEERVQYARNIHDYMLRRRRLLRQNSVAYDDVEYRWRIWLGDVMFATNTAWVEVVAASIDAVGAVHETVADAPHVVGRQVDTRLAAEAVEVATLTESCMQITCTDIPLLSEFVAPLAQFAQHSSRLRAYVAWSHAAEWDVNIGETAFMIRDPQVYTSVRRATTEYAAALRLDPTLWSTVRGDTTTYVDPHDDTLPWEGTPATSTKWSDRCALHYVKRLAAVQNSSEREPAKTLAAMRVAMQNGLGCDRNRFTALTQRVSEEDIPRSLVD